MRDELEVYEDLIQAVEIQDDWVKEHMPRNYRHGYNVSSLYITKTDPPHLLVIASWDSPQAHQQWLDSEENQLASAKINQHVEAPGDSTLLFRMEAAGTHGVVPDSFNQMTSFDVCRFFVESHEKPLVQDKYRALEDALVKLNLGDQLWGGWKSAQSDNAEELVIISSQIKLPLDLAVQKTRLSGKSETRCFHQFCEMSFIYP